MMNEVVLLPEAVDDIAQAYVWYEERSAGLGDGFLMHVEDCVERIRQRPDAFAVVYAQYRRALLRRFPYAIFFDRQGKRITIYGVFHTAREPQKWRRRLG